MIKILCKILIDKIIQKQIIIQKLIQPQKKKHTKYNNNDQTKINLEYSLIKQIEKRKGKTEIKILNQDIKKRNDCKGIGKIHKDTYIFKIIKKCSDNDNHKNQNIKILNLYIHKIN